MVHALPPPPPPTAFVSETRAAARPGVVYEPVPASLVADVFEPPSTVTPAAILEEASAHGLSVESINVGATVPEARELASGGWGRAVIDANTDVRVSIGGSHVSIDVQPGLRLSPRFFPDIRISRIVYDTAEDQIDIQAEGVGPDFLYRWAGNALANRYLKELIPSSLRQGGANANDGEALARAMATLSNFSGAAPAGAGSSAAPPLVNPSGSAYVRVTRDIRVDLPDGMALFVPRNTGLSLVTRLEGPAEAPRLDTASLRISGPGVEIRKSEGFMSELAGIRVESVTLRHGGHIDVEYELLAERAVDGGIDLLRLFVAVAGAERGDPRGLESLTRPRAPTRFNGLRATVDAEIRSRAEPALADAVRANDGAVEGYSLMQLLGIPPAD